MPRQLQVKALADVWVFMHCQGWHIIQLHQLTHTHIPPSLRTPPLPPHEWFLNATLILAVSKERGFCGGRGDGIVLCDHIWREWAGIMWWQSLVLDLQGALKVCGNGWFHGGVAQKNSSCWDGACFCSCVHQVCRTRWKGSWERDLSSPTHSKSDVNGISVSGLQEQDKPQGRYAVWSTWSQKEWNGRMTLHGQCVSPEAVEPSHLTT